MLINQHTDITSLSFEDEIEFEIMDKQDLLSFLDQVLDKEEAQFDVKNLTGQTFKLNFKNQPTENLVAILEHTINRETLVNTRLMLNLQIFVNGYSTFDDSLFESPEIFLSKIEQVLDVKLALLDSLKSFGTYVKLVEYTFVIIPFS